MFKDDSVVVDGKCYTKLVREELEKEYNLELDRAEGEQIALMEAEQRLTGGVRQHLDWGRLRMKLCPEIYHFWGTKLGYECFDSEEFKKWLEKHFGDLVKIKSKSGKLMI